MSPTNPTGDSRTPFAVRTPRDELEAFARRRIESQRRADPAEAARIEDALQRALELLEEAEDDDDLA